MPHDPSTAARPHRAAFFRCFLASLLLVLIAAGASVYLNAVDRQLFETALLENVDYAALGMDADSVRSFSDETILFLTDAQDSWEPSITVAGFPASRFIPQNFRDHMVTVTDDHRFAAGFVQDVRILGGKGGQFADGGIFFKDDLTVVAGKNFQWVALADAQGAADFLGNDHTTQVIDSSNDSGSFHNSTLSLSVWFVLIVFAAMRENMQAVLAAFFKREGK